MSTRPDLTGARWRKSTKSDQQDCVEVADNLPGTVYVRDTKDRSGPMLSFEPSVWNTFLAALKAGGFRG